MAMLEYLVLLVLDLLTQFGVVHNVVRFEMVGRLDNKKDQSAGPKNCNHLTHQDSSMSCHTVLRGRNRIA